MPRKTTPLATRFWPKVAIAGPDECWLWTAGTVRGYGRVGRGRRGEGGIYAHRLAWELTHGPIPDGLLVCHRCDVALCCNPAHLYVGTYTENLHDALERSARHARRRLYPADVGTIRERLAAGETCAAIARDYGVTRVAISRIKHGRTWHR